MLRANYRALGIDALVDVRQLGSSFQLPDYTDASFAALPHWYEGSFRVHLNDAGYAVVAQMVAPVMRRLPLRY